MKENACLLLINKSADSELLKTAELFRGVMLNYFKVTEIAACPTMEQFFSGLKGWLKKNRNVVVLAELQSFHSVKYNLLKGLGLKPVVSNAVKGSLPVSYLPKTNAEYELVAGFPEGSEVFVTANGLYSGFCVTRGTRSIYFLPFEKGMLNEILNSGLAGYFKKAAEDAETPEDIIDSVLAERRASTAQKVTAAATAAPAYVPKHAAPVIPAPVIPAPAVPAGDALDFGDGSGDGFGEDKGSLTEISSEDFLAEKPARVKPEPEEKPTEIEEEPVEVEEEPVEVEEEPVEVEEEPVEVVEEPVEVVEEPVEVEEEPVEVVEEPVEAEEKPEEAAKPEEEPEEAPADEETAGAEPTETDKPAEGGPEKGTEEEPGEEPEEIPLDDMLPDGGDNEAKPEEVTEEEPGEIPLDDMLPDGGDNEAKPEEGKPGNEPEKDEPEKDEPEEDPDGIGEYVPEDLSDDMQAETLEDEEDDGDDEFKIKNIAAPVKPVPLYVPEPEPELAYPEHNADDDFFFDNDPIHDDDDDDDGDDEFRITGFGISPAEQAPAEPTEAEKEPETETEAEEAEPEAEKEQKEEQSDKAQPGSDISCGVKAVEALLAAGKRAAIVSLGSSELVKNAVSGIDGAEKAFVFDVKAAPSQAGDIKNYLADCLKDTRVRYSAAAAGAITEAVAEGGEACVYYAVADEGGADVVKVTGEDADSVREDALNALLAAIGAKASGKAETSADGSPAVTVETSRILPVTAAVLILFAVILSFVFGFMLSSGKLDMGGVNAAVMTAAAKITAAAAGIGR